MKTKKKALLVVLAAVLLLSVSVLGTLAWLYDTETKGYDVFTVGDIDITFAIDETWDVAAHDNEWVPNQDYTMNPTITVKGGSEECYIRMFITITDAFDLLTAAADVDKVGDIFLIGHYVDLAAGQYFVDEGTNNWNDEDWYNYTAGNVYDAAANTITYEFRLRNTIVEADTDTVVNGVFDTFTLPFYFNNEDVASLEDMTVTFEVQAIQAYEKGHTDKFTEAEAWAAYEAQVAIGTADGRLPAIYPEAGTSAVSDWSDAE